MSFQAIKTVKQSNDPDFEAKENRSGDLNRGRVTPERCRSRH